ncbi:uncharacterized protein FPRN_09974 [Fusarium proliferatum]|nr:uncharacterized protein FPRN_09974 [Fusarium proliferatum]
MSETRPNRWAASPAQDETPYPDDEDDSPSYEALENAKNLFDRRHRVIGTTAAEIVRMITRPTPEGWSDNDEAVISGYWDASPAKTYSANIHQDQHAALLALFQTSIRVTGLAPITMISPIYGLWYQPVSRDNTDLESIYSQKFCGFLTALIVHPGFGRKRHHIIWALHYAVACRLDDRRAWPHEQYDGYCPALELVSQRIGNFEAPESIHTMHKSAREEVIAHGDRDPTPWSDFLHHLGETVATHGSPRPPVIEEFRENRDFYLLPVTLWDLQVLEKAVDTMDWPDEDMRYPVSEAWTAWKTVRKGRDVPSIKQLPELFELLHKDIYRQTYIRGSFVPLSDQNESADVIPQPPSPVGGNLAEDIGVGNDDTLPDFQEHSSFDVEMRDEEGMMFVANDELPLEDDILTPVPLALPSNLEALINERLSEFMKHQREISAEQEKRINAPESKIEGLEEQLVDKQRQIDLLKTARSSNQDSESVRLNPPQGAIHVSDEEPFSVPPIWRHLRDAGW